MRLRLGGRLGVLESVTTLLSVIALPHIGRVEALIFWTNLKIQYLLFSLVVFIPALLTSHMAYVDIGWPLGIVLLGFIGILGDGHPARKTFMSMCFLTHGARMAVGGLYTFFPFVWENDLPRYEYARLRYQGKPSWIIRMMHELNQQAFANVSILACPLLLACCDSYPTMHEVEHAGYAIWLFGILWETVADIQKRTAECSAVEVVGYKPHNGWKCFMWTLCRHPNYFGEWLAWTGLAIAAAPCILHKTDMRWEFKAWLLLILCSVPRSLYDCLNYWTGAEPAEYFSVQKRPRYREYQATTRVFWPVELPFVDHGRWQGWPKKMTSHDSREFEEM